jgi:hypothetical protein
LSWQYIGLIADNVNIMMYETAKKAIFFTNLRIIVKPSFGQLIFLLILIVLLPFFLLFCDVKKEEAPVVPPVTSPLSGEYIGFGVITESFTHISADPSQDSTSLGYLRRGSRVRIIRRQIIKTQDGFVSWVLTDGSQQGWLKEDVMDIYNNENQAITASEQLSR